MKKILITGINGFIGSNCAEYYSKKGYEIYGIDLNGEVSDYTNNFLNDEVTISSIKSFDQKFDIIFHFAGSGTVELSRKQPMLEHKKTVRSTEYLLEYMKLYNKESKLIYPSSAAVYGDLYDRPIKENDTRNPISIYGKQKVEVEDLCRNYHNHIGLNISVIRFFSIYGDGLKKQLLYDSCNKFYNYLVHGERPFFRGTGKEVRDFIHISDAVDFIEKIISINGYNIYNCGSGIGHKISNIVNMIAVLFGYNKEIIFNQEKLPENPLIMIANISKASRRIQWSPVVGIEEGIKKYVTWYKKNQISF